MSGNERIGLRGKNITKSKLNNPGSIMMGKTQGETKRKYKKKRQTKNKKKRNEEDDESQT